MPKVGEFRLCCVDEWDPSQRCDDEEYYADVESMVQGGEAADHVYMVQDVEENTGPEKMTRQAQLSSMYVCVCVTICSDVDFSSITQCLAMCIACTHSIH